MTQAKPIITESRVEAFIASALRLLGWLLGAVLRGAWSGRGGRLQRLLSRAEFAVECILFLKAVALYGPAPQRRRHPRSTPPGFRRLAGSHRLFFRSAKIRAGKKAGALARVLALIEALTRPGRAVAHFFKRICKGLQLSRLVAAAPPSDTIACAPFCASPATDSS